MKLILFSFFLFMNLATASVHSDLFQDHVITLKEKDVLSIEADGEEDVHKILAREELGENKWKVPHTLNLGYGPTPRWFRINIQNDGGLFTIKYLYPMMQTAKMYLIKDKQIISEAIGGKKHKNETYRGVVINSDLKGEQTVLLYLESSGPFQVPISLGVYNKVQYQISLEYLALGTWLGLILALMIYYFIIYLKMHEAMYLYYSLYGLSLLVINLSFSGIFYQYLPNFSPYLKPRLAIVSIGLMLVFLTLFSKYFFEIFKDKGFPKYLTMIVNGCILVPLVLTIINLVNYSTSTILLTGILGIVIPLVLIGIALYMLFKRRNGSYLYIVATGSVLTGFIVYCLKDFAVLPHTHVTSYALFYSSSFEMLLLAIAIANKFRDIQFKNESLMKSMILKENELALTSIAQQLAHDIRSPLEVLKSIKGEIKSDNKDVNKTFQMSINRIEEITFNLLNSYKKSAKVELKNDSKHLLEIMNSIIQEKKIEFRTRSSVEIVETFDSHSYGLFSNLKHGSLKSIISNLINNSIDSLNGREGVVIVSLNSIQDKNIIAITDNGLGIPEAIRGHIFTKGFTTKLTGNGLGLFNAKTEIESWGGSLTFETSIGKGTTFKITLPKSETSSSFVSSIDAGKYERIIILDDDLAFHEVWNKRLEGLDSKVEHIYSVEEMLSKYQALHPKILLLSDFELMDKQYDGIDTILKLKHAENSILVTARSEEQAIQDRCLKAGIKLLPKSLVNYVKVVCELSEASQAQVEPSSSMVGEVVPGSAGEAYGIFIEGGVARSNETDLGQNQKVIILIDDDKLVRLNWASHCKKKELPFQAFASIADFLASSSSIDKSSKIYIDSNLGDGIVGEIESEKIFALGFLELYLATGYEKDSIKKPAWIKEIYSKSPENAS